MKSTITLMLAALAAAALFFGACESQSLENLDPQANLLSLSIMTAAGKTIEVLAIPVAIQEEEWDDEEYDVGGADFGTMPVKTLADTEEARFAVTVSPGAQVRWGTARGGNRPDYFTDPRVSATFGTNDFVYFKVTANDGMTTNYYRFYSVLASPVKELAAISIAGRDPNEFQTGTQKWKVPAPSENLEDVPGRVSNQSFRGQIDITRGEARDGVLVAAEPQDKTAKIRYAVASTTADAIAGNFSDFKDTVERVIQDEQEKDVFQAVDTMSFTDGTILLVEVTAQNEADVFYYIFQVTAGRMTTIANLDFDGIEVVGKGTQHAQWASVTPGSFNSADQQAGGFAIGIELEDPEGSFDYAVISNKGAAQPSAFSTPGKIEFTDKQALAIRVRSARGTATDTRYYKVEVNLLAANFRTQPKSAAYTVTNHNLSGRITISNSPESITLDRPIEPITFEVDRPKSGFTYQWYTANSWYGGYGFDMYGRIAGDEDYEYDEYHPRTGRNPPGLDEKNNVSLHNGGNEFYRLPYDGFQIVGANSDTYTPQITSNNRPFLSGFSNQTQYYWVEITDNEGRKVTSKRAAIVTEWNQTWNMGTPGAKFAAAAEKKHYIMDLYAYLDTTGNTPGLQGNPRNATPFKAGNHGDQYYIPLKFPAGFNIMEYSVVTAQALFYLADGRAWIQNWTQGDFGFADAADADSTPEKLVLWYNLTNDNATRGLAGSGNEPQGSGLTTIPSHLVIQPAGTSPIKQMPPFGPDGQPDKAEIEAQGKTAQGWFTPYIEIVELRFEGPTRIGQ